MGATVRAKVSSKGQVTLPKAIRDALGVDESSTVQFELTDGGALLTRVDGGFLARFGTAKPRRRPEDWDRVRTETAKQVGRRAARADR